MAKQIIYDDVFDALAFGVVPQRPAVHTPEVVDERVLISLCEQYKARIADGWRTNMPEVRIRYVEDRHKFGTACFGNFFFTPSGELYVFTWNAKYAGEHNAAIKEKLFGKNYKRRDYAVRVLFAGVLTPYRDSNGKRIFTGDVIDINDGEMQFALSTFGSDNPRYAFVLDNHLLLPKECRKMTRIGTVFYKLDPMENKPVLHRCMSFQNAYPDGVPRESKLIMAKYTPNFDQEEWKYIALDELGAEFNWNK